MKFKKTKLTALAMSVLMAASTITSVTWAADLFTDGTPAEVAVEAPVEVISDGETEEMMEATAVEGKVTGVKFHYNIAGDVVVDYNILTTTGQTMPYSDQQVEVLKTKPADCFYPARAIYTCKAVNGTNIYPDLDNGKECWGYTTTDGITRAISEDDRKAGYLVCTENSKTLGGTYGHDLATLKTYEITTTGATCEHVGSKIVYKGCKWCKTLMMTNPNPFMGNRAYGKANPTEADLKGYLNGSSQRDFDSDGEPDIWTEVIETTSHVFGDKEIPVTQAYLDYKYDSVTKEYKYFYTTHPELAGKKFEPYNCEWDGTQMVTIDPAKDAYYYVVHECKYCGFAEYADKRVINDKNGNHDGVYYEVLRNIEGFVGIKNGEYYVKTTASARGIEKTPDLLDPPVAVLQDCTLTGYYDVTTYVTDTYGPVSKTSVEVKPGHIWGSEYVVPAKTPFIDGTVSATEDTKLLMETNTTKEVFDDFFVVRDANGKITEVKSKNCVTKGKYQLGHYCFSCGKWEKVGDLKTTDVNPDIHQWGKWSNTPVDSDNEYLDLGDGVYHLKHTYVCRYCDLCGKKDKKLYSESKEAHRLIETKIDEDDPDYDKYKPQEPTCGKDGYYYVHLECPCGFADKNSVKTEKIPATDKHEFGDNPVEIQWFGTVQVGGRVATEPETSDPTHKVYAALVRKCTKCGEYDSNGIDNASVGKTGELRNNDNDLLVELPAVGGTVLADRAIVGRTFTDYVPAKVDPTTKVPYSCSVGTVTVNIEWAGKVDGKPVKITAKKEKVPYYPSDLAYQGARAHRADDVRIIDKVDATATQEGSYTRVVYCSVCHDEVSRETVTIAKLGSAPAVTAKAVDYNTVDISWDAVEGASEYNLYYKSADMNITRWRLARVVKGTSFTHTGLQTGARYRYTVRAVVDGVLGAFDKTGSVARPMPTAPVMKSVTAQGKKTIVSWSKAEGATGYIVFRKTPTGSWTRVGTVKSGKVSWTDKKPVSGSTYKVRSYRTVKGVNYKSGFSDVK